MLLRREKCSRGRCAIGKKSTTTTSNEPSQYAKGYLTPAANALGDAYTQSQPGVAQASSLIGQNLPGLASKAFGANPALDAANGYNTDVLNGKYLGQGNPFLNQMIGSTDASVRDQINSTFGAASRTGGDQHVGALGTALANAENGLRYQDYANERSAMGQASANLPGLNQAQYAGVAPFLAMAGGTTLPLTAAQEYANGTGSLVGNYGNSSTTQKGSAFDSFLKLAGTAASAAGAFSDRRLKRNIEKVGEMPDGLGIYEYDYNLGTKRQVGVMADEVARLRPWALGARVNGFATVHYDMLEAA